MNPVVKVNLWCFHLSLFSRNPRPDSGEARLPSLHQRSPLSSRSSGSLSTQVQPPRSRKVKKLEFLCLQTASASNGISLNVLSKTNDRDSNAIAQRLLLLFCFRRPCVVCLCVSPTVSHPANCWLSTLRWWRRWSTGSTVVPRCCQRPALRRGASMLRGAHRCPRRIQKSENQENLILWNLLESCLTIYLYYGIGGPHKLGKSQNQTN